MKNFNKPLNDIEKTLLRIFLVNELNEQIIRYNDTASMLIQRHDGDSFYINIFDYETNLQAARWYINLNGDKDIENKLVDFINEKLQTLQGWKALL